MKKFKLTQPTIDAIEVTPAFVYSLPNAGAVLQRFGEQVEIMGPAPLRRKTYAQIGEYICKIVDGNNVEHFVVLSQTAFKALLELADEEPVAIENPAVEPAPVEEKKTSKKGGRPKKSVEEVAPLEDEGADGLEEFSDLSNLENVKAEEENE